MTEAGRTLAGAVSGAVRRVRRRGLGAVLAVSASVPPLLLLIAWAVGRWGERGPGPVLLIGAGVAATLGVGVWLFRRWVVPADEARLAAEVERVRGLPEGSLEGVLELGRGFPPGVSAALFRRTEAEIAARLAGAGPDEISGRLGDQASRRWWRAGSVAAVLLLLTGAAGLGSPDRARAAWGPLMSPVDHLRGPDYPPLVVLPGDTVVARGDAPEVVVEAPLRQRIEVRWRSVGEVPAARSAGVEGGRAAIWLDPVESEIRYWAEAPDGAVSDTFTIRPRDPLLLAELAVQLEYPAHTGRAGDRFQGSLPPLVVPEGTRLRFDGRATAALRGAVLARVDEATDPGRPAPDRGTPDPGTPHAGTITHSADLPGEEVFSLAWTPARADGGEWHWLLRGIQGDTALSDPLRVEVAPDRPPAVRIAVPGQDTILGPSRRQVVVAEATDDYGVGGAALVYRRLDAAGRRGEPVRVSIPVTEGPRSVLRTVLDAGALPLSAGDAVEYHVVVTDNGPAARSGRSATYVLRIPGMAGLRDRAREEAAEALDAAERLAERSRSLESATRALSRRASSGAPTGRAGSGAPFPDAGTPSPLRFEEARESRELVQRHEAMAAAVDSMRAQVESVERALEEAGLRDPEIQRRLDDLKQLYGELVGPDLRDRLEAVRSGVEALDPEAVARALERLAEGQDSFREELERSLEIMRRAAAEQELSSLAREAEEIAAQQTALAESMRPESSPPQEAADPAAARPDSAVARDPGAPESAGGERDPGASDPRTEPAAPQLGAPEPDRAAQQESLEARTRELGGSLQQLQQRLAQLGEGEASSQTGQAREQTRSAEGSMGEAGKRARSRDGEGAAASGQRAASQMAEAARALDQARSGMSEAGRQQAEEAVEQATSEALGLAQRQEALRRQMEAAQRQGGGQGTMQGLRSEQAALQQGLEQLGRNLTESGRRAGSMDPQVARSLERARAQVGRTMEGLEQGGIPARQAGRSVESLNQLAMSLLERGGSQGGGGGEGTQQALQRLGELAREQGALNGQVAGLSPLDLSREALTRQLSEAAERQRGIGRRVGSLSSMLGGEEDVLGRLDLLASEAEEIARSLQGDRLDPETLARQERLFHRLLDAGRSLEREEYTDERVSARGTSGSERPDAADPRLLEAVVRYPPPSAEELRGLPPAYQRLILEYFERLNRSPGGEDGR